MTPLLADTSVPSTDVGWEIVYRRAHRTRRADLCLDSELSEVNSGHLCHPHLMNEKVGLRELRQQGSELMRRAETGEAITVTVSGRPAARLVPVRRDTWRRFDQIDELFAGPGDVDWVPDRSQLDERISGAFG